MPRSGISLFMFTTSFVMFFGTNDNAYRKLKLMGEFKIPLVVSRYGHNGSGAHSPQNIVRYPDWNFLTDSWVYRRYAGKNSGLFGCLLYCGQRPARESVRDILFNFFVRLPTRIEPYFRALGSNNHKRGTEY